MRRPHRLRAAAVVAAIAAALCGGCVGTTGHLAAVSSRSLAASDLLTEAPPRHVTGRSCIRVIVVVPTHMPNFGQAIADALEDAHARVLTDVTIRYELFYIPLVYGVACYVAEGDAR